MRKKIFIGILFFILLVPIFADGWEVDLSGLEPQYNISANLGWGVNLKYFPYAKDYVDDYLLVNLKTFNFGVDGVYNLGSHFALGVDINAHYRYNSNLLDNRHHLATEIFGEARFFWGKRTENVIFPTFSASILLGAGVFTNFQIINVVPVCGIKLLLDFYSINRFSLGLFVRSTAFFFFAQQEAYSCLDATTSVGLRFGLWKT